MNPTPLTDQKIYPGMAEKRTKLRVAFDVDGTLIKKTANGDVPRYEVIAVLKAFLSWGHIVFVWSGGGKDWAENWCRKLDLFPDVRVLEKRGDAYDIDLCFDDYATSLAKVDVMV